MAKLVYKYQDYSFEFYDDRSTVSQEEYDQFVDNCRTRITEDRDNNKRERQELLGVKSSTAGNVPTK